MRTPRNNGPTFSDIAHSRQNLADMSKPVEFGINVNESSSEPTG
jgi:hypothetical protein